MFRASHDRRLRVLVADLAQLDPQDADAILADLSHEQRRQVQALMDQFAGHPDAVKPQPERDYSGWIRERMGHSGSPRTLPSFKLTDTARRTLVELANRPINDAAPRGAQ